MINSRNKGKAGELEAVHFINAYGFQVHRSQQYSGANSDADIDGIDGVHIEVKRNEHLNIENALQQAERDAKQKIPIVLHRKNREKWKVTIRADIFMQILKILIQTGDIKNVGNEYCKNI